MPNILTPIRAELITNKGIGGTRIMFSDECDLLSNNILGTGFNPDPSLEIYIIRLTLRNYAVETEFFSAHLSLG